MAEAGKAVVMGTVWFQFWVTQVVAVIMLSSSISEEIYNRTLGLLMTTPISSFQIVMGKLFSKILQLILLLAISLPVLAIVRVLGGVPWGYVISSLCITLTSIIFGGSLSLFFSIFTRRTYFSIILTSLTLGTLFVLLPYLSGVLYHAITGSWPGDALTKAIFYNNPYMVLLSNSKAMTSAGIAGGLPSFYWTLHCGIVLAASAVVLFLSVIMVRKVALAQAAGHLGFSFRKHRSGKEAIQAPAHEQSRAGKIRRVAGPPVLWKELRFPLLGRHKVIMLTTLFIGLVLLIISYVACGIDGDLDDGDTQALYAMIFLGLGMLFSIVLSSTSITCEKESRSWPLLLLTTLDDGQILFGKFVGILRRCLPVWFLLLGHVLLFSLIGCIHPVAILQTGILVVWVVAFLTGAGLYFGSRFKHATMAVTMTLALAAVIWVILPLFMFLVLDAVHASDDSAETCMDINPFIHAAVIMDATAGNRASPSDYDWVGSGNMGATKSTVWMLICMGVYGLFGFLFAWRAKSRFRRNIL
jgi:ABC-type transport system involved in multi-copper enzyme maturation permease subunit